MSFLTQEITMIKDSYIFQLQNKNINKKKQTTATIIKNDLKYTKMSSIVINKHALGSYLNSLT